MLDTIWKQSEVINWSQILLDSYEQLLGYPLLERTGTALEQAKELFFAPFVLASHGTEPDPILNYGNQAALALWEMTWEEFTRTPSRLTAEPINQEKREQMLIKSLQQGFITNYQGVRISKTGKRFQIEQVTVWNLRDSQGKYCGQAATFSHWYFL